MPVIETEELTKRFGSTLAVDGLSLRVGRGQVFGFLGPNGSGKTTTIGMLLGILTPTSGRFRLLGEESRAGLVRARHRIGATLEQPNFYPYLSGRDNLRLVARVKGAAGREVDAALDTVGLAGRADDRYDGYSLGMKQRLALAGTLLGDPELLILDEPTNGLDPEGMREIREVIRRVGDRGRTVFLSSHLLSEVERVCTHVAILREGRVVRQASVEEVTTGAAAAVLEAPDPGALARAVDEYPPVVSSRRRDGGLVVELEDDDLGALNRFLAERGVHLSRLEPRRRTLEEAFMEVTGADEREGMGEVA